MSWSTAFLWTLALELPIYALFLRTRLRARSFFFAVLGGNAFTHPIVWNTVLRFDDYDTGFWVMECFAVLAEGLFVAIALRLTANDEAPSNRSMAWRTWGHGLLAALAANGFSAIVGPKLIAAVAAY